MKKPTSKSKHKSKGKQHPLHAESLDAMAETFESYGFLSGYNVAKVLRDEAKRVRTILR